MLLCIRLGGGLRCTRRSPETSQRSTGAKGWGAGAAHPGLAGAPPPPGRPGRGVPKMSAPGRGAGRCKNLYGATQIDDKSILAVHKIQAWFMVTAIWQLHCSSKPDDASPADIV